MSDCNNDGLDTGVDDDLVLELSLFFSPFDCFLATASLSLPDAVGDAIVSKHHVNGRP